ncbi:MAG: hypothetical protein BMS9Abin13_064 [Patescibacteria group bacterium]|nr:MAG: hypothetical protein BMS9Abin13_064 [Patescibacteria group bacterium]
MAQSVFFTNFLEQKKTIKTLIEESRADADFYLFLGGSSIITTLGLLMDSSIVVIGGMLVAPLLFPILSLGMGVVTSSKEAIDRSLKTIGKSILLVFFVSFFFAFLINSKEVTPVIYLASTASLAHFLIAFVSGLVAALAWVRQNANAALPGIAVSVSLIPPLSALAVGASFLDKDIISGSLMLFIINLIGIVVAGMIVFSLFGFSQLQKVQEKIIKEEERKTEENREKKEDADGIVIENIEERGGTG